MRRRRIVTPAGVDPARPGSDATVVVRRRVTALGEMPPIVVECTIGRERTRCCACGVRDATTRCGTMLLGRLTGQPCDRPLCARCASQVHGVDTCPAHARRAGVPT